MNPINNMVNQQIISLTQKYPQKHTNRPTSSFQDILQLKNQQSMNDLEDYNYTVPVKETDLPKQNTNEFVVFPPKNAPEGVKRAFEALNLSESNGEKDEFILWIYGLTVGLETLKQELGYKTNIRIDPNASINEQLESYFSQSGFSYVEMTNNLINIWERSKSFNHTINYIERMQLLEKFKSNLIENGIK